MSSGLLLTKKAWKVYEPHGVIGVISPWNFPLTLAMSPTVTALYAGNAVVLKPSEVTPLVGDIVAEAFTAAEVHPDVVQVLSGDGSTGAALVHAGVDKIAFTGSARTGKKIMAAAAETLTPVVMELGGKDPMVVCADADIENAAAGAVWAGFANSGQICMSIERAYVPEAVHDRFVGAVVERTEALRQGVDSDEHPVDVGAMIAPTQAAIVEAHIADARQGRRGPHRRGAAQRPRRRLLRPHGPDRLHPRHGHRERGDLRAGPADREGARRGRGRAPRERQPLRAHGVGVDGQQGQG